jgi:GRIP domain
MRLGLTGEVSCDKFSFRRGIAWEAAALCPVHSAHVPPSRLQRMVTLHCPQVLHSSPSAHINLEYLKTAVVRYMQTGGARGVDCTRERTRLQMYPALKAMTVRLASATPHMSLVADDAAARRACCSATHQAHSAHTLAVANSRRCRAARAAAFADEASEHSRLLPVIATILQLSAAEQEAVAVSIKRRSSSVSAAALPSLAGWLSSRGSLSGSSS